VAFSGTPVSSTNKTDRHDIAEMLLKVALNTINQNPLDDESGTISCSAGLYLISKLNSIFHKLL
jgi:hypothetical protein